MKNITDTDKAEIYLSWEEDRGAGSYIVMRAEDNDILEFKKIYEGKDTFFTDKDISVSTKYVYRLDKRRGDYLFKGEEYSYAYYHGVMGGISADDIYEDNNSMSKAKRLDNQCSCTSYLVKFKDGTVLYDEDWFFVTIPADFTLSISVREDSPVIESGETDLQIYVNGKCTKDQTLNQGEVVDIKNELPETVDIYFRITIKMDSLRTEDEYEKLVGYSLRLDKMIR